MHEAEEEEEEGRTKGRRRRNAQQVFHLDILVLPSPSQSAQEERRVREKEEGETGSERGIHSFARARMSEWALLPHVAAAAACPTKITSSNAGRAVVVASPSLQKKLPAPSSLSVWSRNALSLSPLLLPQLLPLPPSTSFPNSSTLM